MRLVFYFLFIIIMDTPKNLRQKLFEFQKLHLRIGKNAEAGKDSKW